MIAFQLSYVSSAATIPSDSPLIVCSAPLVPLHQFAITYVASCARPRLRVEPVPFNSMRSWRRTTQAVPVWVRVQLFDRHMTPSHSIFVIMMVMTLLFAVPSVLGAVSSGERAALVDLYLNTSGPTSWTTNTGWTNYTNALIDPCVPTPWYGVACATAPDRVM